MRPHTASNNLNCLSDTCKISTWGKVETALAIEQASLGMIPSEAAEEISRMINTLAINEEKITELQKQTGHVFIPYLRLIEKACSQYGPWLHYGATTENILYSGLALQMRDALAEITQEQNSFLHKLYKLIIKHKNTVMAGRTQSQQALPITFGYKLAAILDEFLRHIERQKNAADNSLRISLGGAVGSFASFGEHGPQLQEAVAKRLGLPAVDLPSRSITDNYVELAQTFTLSASSIAKLMQDFKTMMRNEIGEVFQDDGTVGSSTMPQKRNPVAYNSIIHACNSMQHLTDQMLTMRIQADDGDSLCGNTHRENITEVLQIYYFIVKKSSHILDTLVVNEERMRNNLNCDGGWIMAEAVMFEIAHDIGKNEAHDVLHELAMSSRESGKSLKETLLKHPRLSQLGEARILEIINPASYTGLCTQLCEETLLRAEKVIL